MSLKEFQRVLVDLTLNPSVARSIKQEGGSALKEYDLSQLECDRVLNIVRQPGISVHCSLSRGNRFEEIAAVFPMTCVLLEPVLGAVLDELWRSSRPQNYQLSGEEAAFAALVGRKLADGSVKIEYLHEIFAYEMICWDLARRMRLERDPNFVIKVRMEFQHSPGDLLPPLSRLEAPPPGLLPGCYPACVTLRGERFDVAMLTAE